MMTKKALDDKSQVKKREFRERAKQQARRKNRGRLDRIR